MKLKALKQEADIRSGERCFNGLLLFLSLWLSVPIFVFGNQEAPTVVIHYRVVGGIGEIEGPTEARVGDTIVIRAIPGKDYVVDRISYSGYSDGEGRNNLMVKGKEASFIVKEQTSVKVGFTLHQEGSGLTLQSLGLASPEAEDPSWFLLAVTPDGSRVVGHMGRYRPGRPVWWNEENGTELIPFTGEFANSYFGTMIRVAPDASSLYFHLTDRKEQYLWGTVLRERDLPDLYRIGIPGQSVEDVDVPVWGLLNDGVVITRGGARLGSSESPGSAWPSDASGDILSDDGTFLLGHREDIVNGSRWQQSSGEWNVSESPVLYSITGETYLAPPKASASGRWSSIGQSLSGNGERVGILREEGVATSTGGAVIWDGPSGHVYSLPLRATSIDLNHDGSLALIQGRDASVQGYNEVLGAAYLYEVGGRIVSIEDLLKGAGLSAFEDWREVSARFISGDGTKIFGNGVNPAGVREPWMLTGLDPDKIFPKVRIGAGVASDGGGQVQGQGDYSRGAVVTLSATAASGYRFQRWIGDIESDQNPLEIRALDDLDVVAEFVREADFVSPIQLNAEMLRRATRLPVGNLWNVGSNTNYLVSVSNETLLVRDNRSGVNNTAAGNYSIGGFRVSDNDRTVVISESQAKTLRFFRLPSLTSIGQLIDREGTDRTIDAPTFTYHFGNFYETWGFSPDSNYLVYPRKASLDEVGQYRLRIVGVETLTVITEIPLLASHDRLVVKNTTGTGSGRNNPYSFVVDGVDCFLIARSNGSSYTTATLEFVEWRSGRVVKRHTVEDGRFNEGDFSSDGVFFYPSSAQNSIVGVNLLTGKLKKRIGALHANDFPRFSQRIGYLNFHQDGDIMSWLEYEYRNPPTESFDYDHVREVWAFSPDKPRQVKGYVYDDANANGILDLQRVPSRSPHIIFVADTSISTRATLQGVSVDNPNRDRYRNSILDAEIHGVREAYESLRRYGRADDARIALVSYSGTALAYGPNGVVENREAWMSANADENGNLELDVIDALSRLSYNSTIVVEQSSYVSALDKVRGIIAETGVPGDSVLVVFLSDGRPDFGGLDPSLSFLLEAGVKFQAVGITDMADLDSLMLMDKSAARVLSSTELIRHLHFSPSEAVLSGATVHADVNRDGVRDGWEPSSVSFEEDPPTLALEEGFYELSEVTLGTVPIYAEVAGFEQAESLVLSESRGGEEIIALPMKAIVVHERPTIESQPQGGVVGIGGDFVFSVVASGEITGYQWYFMDQLVVGQDQSILRLENISMNNAGDYKVVVTGPGGSIFSVSAGLEVEISTNPHPADTNEDFSLSIAELTAYGAAWKSGQNWSVGPNPIPIGFLTRAGALWKGGEHYEYDPSLGAKPLSWVNTIDGRQQQSVDQIYSVSEPQFTRSVRTMGDLFEVTLTASANGHDHALAWEEYIPHQLDLETIPSDFFFDESTRALRVGPYFSSDLRTLKYFLRRDVVNEENLVWRGRVGWDGHESHVKGVARLVPLQHTTKDSFSVQFSREGMLIVNAGEEETVSLERSIESPAGPWEPIQRLRLDGYSVVWNPSLDGVGNAVFFRATASAKFR